MMRVAHRVLSHGADIVQAEIGERSEQTLPFSDRATVDESAKFWTQIKDLARQ
jgi:hypothetical protein